MPETDSLTEYFAAFKLEFVEREVTPQPLMKLSIHLYVPVLSLLDTIAVLDMFGVNRCRTTVHNKLRTTDLQPADGKAPNHVALDETVIQLNNERFCVLAAVDPETNEFLHVTLHPASTIALTGRFLRYLCEKNDSSILFFINDTPWLQAALHRYNGQLRYETRVN